MRRVALRKRLRQKKGVPGLESPEKPWRVVVIEDQTLFRHLLVEILQSDSHFVLVGESGDGQTGWETCCQQKPDLVILDLQLPSMDGLEIATRLREAMPSARILAVTSLNDLFTVHRVIQLELPGYIEKHQPLSVLKEALFAVASGQTYLTQIVHDTRRRLARDANAFPKILSEREQQIVALVSAGMPSKNIGLQLGLSTRTVENHRYRIMKRLGIDSLAGLIAYAQKNGLSDNSIAPR
jgi:two-component system response regulator NreC